MYCQGQGRSARPIAHYPLQPGAMERATQPEADLRDLNLFINQLLNILMDALASIQAVACRFWLFLILSLQYFDQLSMPVRKAVLGSFGTLIPFHCHAIAEVMSKEFCHNFPAGMIADMAGNKAVLKLLKGGINRQPFLEAMLQSLQNLTGWRNGRFARSLVRLETCLQSSKTRLNAGRDQWNADPSQFYMPDLRYENEMAVTHRVLDSTASRLGRNAPASACQNQLRKFNRVAPNRRYSVTGPLRILTTKGKDYAGRFVLKFTDIIQGKPNDLRLCCQWREIHVAIFATPGGYNIPQYVRGGKRIICRCEETTFAVRSKRFFSMCRPHARFLIHVGP